jgi:hypothetical protein
MLHPSYPPDFIIKKNIRRWLQFMKLLNPLLQNNIYKSSLYLTGNTLRLRYKEQPVNAVQGNSRCLFWEPYGTQKYTVGRMQSLSKLKSMVCIVTTGL